MLCTGLVTRHLITRNKLAYNRSTDLQTWPAPNEAENHFKNFVTKSNSLSKSQTWPAPNGAENHFKNFVTKSNSLSKPLSKRTNPPLQGRTKRRGGAAGLQAPPPPPNPPKPKFKKHRFCGYYDIKSFTWFTLQPKSATEISWWLVH
jgi:hypothetical protein